MVFFSLLSSLELDAVAGRRRPVGKKKFRVTLARTPFPVRSGHLSMLHRDSSRRFDPFDGLGAKNEKKRNGNEPEFEGART